MIIFRIIAISATFFSLRGAPNPSDQPNRLAGGLPSLAILRKNSGATTAIFCVASMILRRSSVMLIVTTRECASKTTKFGGTVKFTMSSAHQPSIIMPATRFVVGELAISVIDTPAGLTTSAQPTSMPSSKDENKGSWPQGYTVVNNENGAWLEVSAHRIEDRQCATEVGLRRTGNKPGNKYLCARIPNGEFSYPEGTPYYTREKNGKTKLWGVLVTMLEYSDEFLGVYGNVHEYLESKGSVTSSDSKPEAESESESETITLADFIKNYESSSALSRFKNSFKSILRLPSSKYSSGPGSSSMRDGSSWRRLSSASTMDDFSSRRHSSVSTMDSFSSRRLSSAPVARGSSSMRFDPRSISRDVGSGSTSNRA